MILSNGEIKEALKKNELQIFGVDDLYIGPSSVDLHLDNKAMILDNIKTRVDDTTRRTIRMDEDSSHFFSEYNDWKEITIFPGEFYLLSTKEHLVFNGSIAGFIQGRSSIARLGINIHAAGFFDPNFQGTATLEVTNFTNCPITIPANTRICQMVFIRTGKEVEGGYGRKKDSKYQGQNGPTLTKGYKDYQHD